MSLENARETRSVIYDDPLNHSDDVDAPPCHSFRLRGFFAATLKSVAISIFAGGRRFYALPHSAATATASASASVGVSRFSCLP